MLEECANILKELASKHASTFDIKGIYNTNLSPHLPFDTLALVQRDANNIPTLTVSVVGMLAAVTDKAKARRLEYIIIYSMQCIANMLRQSVFNDAPAMEYNTKRREWIRSQIVSNPDYSIARTIPIISGSLTVNIPSLSDKSLSLTIEPIVLKSIDLQTVALDLARQLLASLAQSDLIADTIDIMNESEPVQAVRVRESVNQEVTVTTIQYADK